jgi:hypothetical protein
LIEWMINSPSPVMSDVLALKKMRGRSGVCGR